MFVLSISSHLNQHHFVQSNISLIYSKDPSDSKGNSAESLTSVSPSYNSVTGEDKMYGLPDIADFMGYKDQKALSEQGLPNNKGIFADQKSNVYGELSGSK